MDKQRFKGMQMYNHYCGKETADLLGFTQQTLSNILNQKGNSDFSREDIEKLIEAWNLTFKQVEEIFFSKNVSNIDTNVNNDDECM